MTAKYTMHPLRVCKTSPGGGSKSCSEERFDDEKNNFIITDTDGMFP